MHVNEKKEYKTCAINLAKPLHPDLIDEVVKQSVYIDVGLRQLQVEDDGKRVVLDLVAEREEDICARTDRFLNAIQRGFRATEVETVASNQRSHQRPYETEVFAKLVERSWVLDLGQGQVALSGPALTLANALDRSIARIGVEKFKAVERAYPSLIPANVLARCGYTSSFPQHLSIVTHLEENYDAIEQFRHANTDRHDLHIPDKNAFGPPKVCFCPALCYHSYPTLENQHLPAEGHVETSIGRIARYESTSMVGLDRLWEFTQRSIIWLGEDQFCTDRRELAMDVAMGLAKEWDIDCSIETASDPFFTSVSTAKSFWQRGQALKFELRAHVEPQADGQARTIAAASFNLHSVYFGNAFHIIDNSGSPAFSGCASWGLERLVLVIFTQHGMDVEQWPAALRELMKK